MAREAYRSLYGDLTKLKDDSVLKDPAAGDADDDELFELLLAVSDWVDQYCNRHFYPRVDKLLFDGGGDRIIVPDLIAVEELAETDAADAAGAYSGAYSGRVWPGGGYRLLPYNAAPLLPWGRPYGAVACPSRDRGSLGRGEGFAAGQANFSLSGLWGYRFLAEASGATLAQELAATATTAAVSDGQQFRVGQTLLLSGDLGGDKNPWEWEQALVAAIGGNTLTLARGLNGTTAAAHALGASVAILRWPASVERAALIQTARIWTRAADFEPFYVDADLDTDVRLLLEPYRKPAGT